jgi:hypothetical protein
MPSDGNAPERRVAERRPDRVSRDRSLEVHAMRKTGRRSRQFGLALALLALASAPAQAFERKTQPEPIQWGELGPKVFDAVVLRPLGAVSTVLGGVFFVATAPLAAGSVGVNSAWEHFVMEPVDFTFLRPLGDF